MIGRKNTNRHQATADVEFFLETRMKPMVKALRTGPRTAAPAVMSSQYGSSCSDQDMLRSSLVNCIYLTPPGPRLSLEAPAREALTREAEPRGQCVPRQSL